MNLTLSSVVPYASALFLLTPAQGLIHPWDNHAHGEDLSGWVFAKDDVGETPTLEGQPVSGATQARAQSIFLVLGIDLSRFSEHVQLVRNASTPAHARCHARDQAANPPAPANLPCLKDTYGEPRFSLSMCGDSSLFTTHASFMSPLPRAPYRPLTKIHDEEGH